MTIIINTYTGPTRLEIILSAFRKCGVRDPDTEDQRDGLVELNEMMAGWLGQGLDIGYATPEVNPGNLDDLSNIQPADVPAVVSALSMRLLPTLGQQAHPQQVRNANREFALLQGRYTVVPGMSLPYGFRGQGWQRWGNW